MSRTKRYKPPTPKGGWCDTPWVRMLGQDGTYESIKFPTLTVDPLSDAVKVNTWDDRGGSKSSGRQRAARRKDKKVIKIQLEEME